MDESLRGLVLLPPILYGTWQRSVHTIQLEYLKPQGSILGPLLFLIYINDIGVGLTANCRLFADDCTLFKEVNIIL